MFYRLMQRDTVYMAIFYIGVILKPRVSHRRFIALKQVIHPRYKISKYITSKVMRDEARRHSVQTRIIFTYWVPSKGNDSRNT